MDNKLWFYNEMYRENINFCTDITDEDFYEIFHDLTGYRYGEDLFCDGKTIEYGEGILIYLKNSSDIHILAHECFHASNIIMRKRGIKPDLYNDEPQAYLIQWIFGKCHSHIEEIKRMKDRPQMDSLDAFRYTVGTMQRAFDNSVMKAMDDIGNPKAYDRAIKKEIEIQKFLRMNPELSLGDILILENLNGDFEIRRKDLDMKIDSSHLKYLKSISKRLSNGVYKSRYGDIFCVMSEVDDKESLRGINIKFIIVDEFINKDNDQLDKLINKRAYHEQLSKS